MKTLIKVTLIAALSALASQASAATIGVNTLNTSGVNAFDRYSQDDDQNGTGDTLSGLQNSNLGFPGQLTAVDRAQLWDFLLPELTAGQSIEFATLTFRVGNVNNVADFSILGNLAGTGTTGTASLYEDAGYTTDIGTIAQADDNTTFNINVLDFINANYVADSGITWASFRIQSDDIGNATKHHLQLGGLANTTQGLQLSLTVIPEPGTYALLAGCFALASVMIRRRR